MKKISAIFFLGLLSTQAFALKYMCQKAVRANAGKKDSIKAQVYNYQTKGTLEANRAALIAQIDSALKAIESAKCPMDNPDVTRITNPLKEYRKTVSELAAQAAPTPVKAAGPGVTVQNTPSSQPTGQPSPQAQAGGNQAKLSYPCRQVLQRQGGKPAEMEKVLSVYRDAAKNGKVVAVVPGLDVEFKIRAALQDLKSSQCPMDHPEVSTLLEKLNSQQSEIQPLYDQLKKAFDAKVKLADPKNYPDFDKEYAFFNYLDEKYSNLGRLYSGNAKVEWRDFPGISREDMLSTIGINVKVPILKFDKLKEILSTMRPDAEKYNVKMKEFEEKYKDLIKFNRRIGERYLSTRDSAFKKMSEFLTKYVKWMETNFPKLIDMNIRVIKELSSAATELKKPHYIRSVLIPQASEANKQMIEALDLMAKEDKSIANAAKKKHNQIMSDVKAAEKSLEELLLNSQKLPPERYTGADIEKIKSNIVKNFEEKNGSKDNLLKVIIVNQDWKVTDYVSWSNSRAQHHHYSDLGAISVVKKNDKIAILVPTWYRVNHKQKDRVSVGYEYSKETDVYQNKKILISNVK